MAWTDRDLEKLLRDSVFSDPAHKKALRAKLSETVAELGLDKLELVAAAGTLPDPENWKPWQTDTDELQNSM